MDRWALSREEVRELDRMAIEEAGVPSLLLMENAGRACADLLQDWMEASSSEDRVLCLCGPGNNGGDGLVIARTLWNRGFEARAVFLGTQARLEACGEDVTLNARLWRSLGRELEFVEPEQGEEFLRTQDRGIWVDAIFGTGLSRELSGPWKKIVETINRLSRRVLAVDVPSGLDADTGAVLGACVRASATVSFVAPKKGFFTDQGPEHCGEIHQAEIGIPRFLLEALGGSVGSKS